MHRKQGENLGKCSKTSKSRKIGFYVLNDVELKSGIPEGGIPLATRLGKTLEALEIKGFWHIEVLQNFRLFSSPPSIQG